MQIDDSKKAAYDETYLHKLYRNFLKRTINDSLDMEELLKVFKDKNVVVLAPGRSVKANWDEIAKVVAEKKAITISANFFYEVTTDYAFFQQPKTF